MLAASQQWFSAPVASVDLWFTPFHFSLSKSALTSWQLRSSSSLKGNHSPCSYVFGINFIPDMSACFSWPNLQIQTKKLRKKIMKKGGLFFIPLQSNVTGSRYSYTWMSLAQENGWHVLLDVNALGAKEM
ncbi:hypothetical protein CXB51_013949 [Gossypium anomalum]|uniref:Uncharacterized protein n=1 Tax=Gossypium anomalum TaxID=47600 RepID=A0A8J5YYG0_9ROSI|nr:hypothetical protein CXB51_013949 [Gossypium anomalum]